MEFRSFFAGEIANVNRKISLQLKRGGNDKREEIEKEREKLRKRYEKKEVGS
jgi:hypothetical protein